MSRKDWGTNVYESPEWIAKKRTILGRGDPCDLCGASNPNSAHHLVYPKNAMPWECPDDWLLPVCWKPCHGEIQRREARLGHRVYLLRRHMKIKDWEAAILGLLSEHEK